MLFIFYIYFGIQVLIQEQKHSNKIRSDANQVVATVGG